MVLSKPDGENPSRTMPISKIPTTVRSGTCLVNPLSVRNAVRSVTHKSRLSMRLLLVNTLRLARPLVAETTLIFRCLLVYAASQLWLAGQAMLQDVVVVLLNAAFGVLPRRMRIQASRPPYAQIDISRFVPRPEASFLAIPCQALQSSQGTDMQCMAERAIRGINDAFATSCSPPLTRNSVMLVHSPAGIARRPSANHVINLPRGAGGVCGGVRNDHAQAAMRRSLRVAVHLPPSLRLVPRPQGLLPTGPSLGEARINAIIAASTHNARGATIATDVEDDVARRRLFQPFFSLAPQLLLRQGLHSDQQRHDRQDVVGTRLQR